MKFNGRKHSKFIGFITHNAGKLMQFYYKTDSLYLVRFHLLKLLRKCSSFIENLQDYESCILFNITVAVGVFDI